MRKLLLFTALALGLITFDDAVCEAEAAPKLVASVDTIGPTASSINAYTSTGTFITMVAASTGTRNCLTSVSVSPRRTFNATNYTIHILDGGTTTYAVNASTGNPVNVTWPETNPWCGSPKTAAYITGLSLNNAGLTLDVNYQGFTQ